MLSAFSGVMCCNVRISAVGTTVENAVKSIGVMIIAKCSDW